MPSKKSIYKSDVISITILFLFLIVGISYLLIKRKRIRDNPAYTTGIILGIRSGVRGNQDLYYRFKVDQVWYENFTTTIYCNGCKNNCCDPGDSVIIKYDKDDPKNSTLVRESPTGEKVYY